MGYGKDGCKPRPVVNMDDATTALSGKGAGDENFPVASWLLARRHRAPILAFYRFARAADDVADHPRLGPADKLAMLDRLEDTLLGRSDAEAEAKPLRLALSQDGLSAQHALDLLTAFRRDVSKARYASWDELMDYCRYSAAPVGRFVLDVHGESPATWPANDALCAALQVINHLQDCGRDCRQIDRVYVPLDALAAAGATVEDLERDRATPALRDCLRGLVGRTRGLLDEARGFAASIVDRRLAAEVAVIHALAARLVALLDERDPLSQPVHLSKLAMAGIAAGAVVRQFATNRTPAGPQRRKVA